MIRGTVRRVMTGYEQVMAVADGLGPALVPNPGVEVLFYHPDFSSVRIMYLYIQDIFS